MSMKKVGNCYYVHKSNIQELLNILHDDAYKRRIVRLYEFRKNASALPYEVIKYDFKLHKLSFINSPDWYTANEPISGEYTCWNFDKNSQTYRSGGTTVYHSKELFMADDTDLIDLWKAKKRTKLWQSLVTKEEKKLIGNKDYWTNWCKEHGIEI